MKVLVIGGGGREHAIAWKLAESKNVTEIYCAPGNGLTEEGKCKNVDLKDNDEILKFALKEKIDLTIIGPEVYLASGTADILRNEGQVVLGPSKSAAKLEWSKAYAKEFMYKYNVKCPKSKTFHTFTEASLYVKDLKHPVVIKASGLAAGKGVVISDSLDVSLKTLQEMMLEKAFKDAGDEVLIEEYLEGVEASILCITDGKTIIPFISAKDHKKIENGEKGANTGGMGAIAPNPYYTNKFQEDFTENILKPTMEGLKGENLDFRGIIFFGLMLNESGAYLLEYNVRMGDPETEAVLPLLKSDFFDICFSAAKGNLEGTEVSFNEGYCTSIVSASKGYPFKYETNFEITGINEAKALGNIVFGAGVKKENEKILTSGGRVIAVSATGNSLKEARDKAYIGMDHISYGNKYIRTDIGEALLDVRE